MPAIADPHGNAADSYLELLVGSVALTTRTEHQADLVFLTKSTFNNGTPVDKSPSGSHSSSAQVQALVHSEVGRSLGRTLFKAHCMPPLSRLTRTLDQLDGWNSGL